MTTLSRVFSVLLWFLAALTFTFGVLGVISATELVRFATISDDSSSPVARSGSLELAVRVPTEEVKPGDVVLVGAHSSEGSTLGEVIDVSKADTGAVGVTLKGPNRAVPDQWSYELGATSYKHALAIPLLGYLYSFAGGFFNPWMFGVFASLLVIGGLYLLRRRYFTKAERNRDPWFKKLESPEAAGVDELLTYFAEAGQETPELYDATKRKGRS